MLKSVMALIIDGKACAQDLRAHIAAETALLSRQGIVPGLAVVLVGENPASMSYVKGKETACQENGIRAYDYRLEASVSEAALLALVEQLNQDARIHGILVQLPLPEHINEDRVIQAIDPAKDVDGFHPLNLGKMMLQKDTFISCTPFGIMKLLEQNNISPRGKHVVICGRSAIVGKPLANLFLNKGPFADATVTVCHSRTPDLRTHTLQADILVAAMGKPGLIRADMVKDGAVVIDVGVNRVEDPGKKSGFRLAGDVDYAGLLPKVSAITPVPGGVGPMTITMLLYNTLKSARAHAGLDASLSF